MNWLILVVAILGLVAVLYILYLQFQLAAYRRHIVIVPEPREESRLGCWLTLLLAFAIPILLVLLSRATAP